MIVKVDKLSHDLRGITKINNKITFVSNVLPNEIVDVKIINEKKNFNEAKVISYIEKSSDRIENKCPYSDKCGGCDFGYLNYKTELPQVQYLREPYGYAKRKDTLSCVFSGAASQIRTGDLILTKDALYLLSYSSKVYAP